MTTLAIIGGTGISALDGMVIERRQVVRTPYGQPSSAISHGVYGGKQVIFLPRHGAGHHIPPHQINYRANLWCLHELGIKTILAIAAVGSINADMRPADLVIPHQLIDYTYGRQHTFFEEGPGELGQTVNHIDFTEPYCAALRAHLLTAAAGLAHPVHDHGVYAVTQGPRLETAAEVDRLERDGCDLIGMTGMPEAALARELDICYATCAVVANAAAGRGPATITMAEVDANLTVGVTQVRQLLARVIPMIA